jgi:WS/DGAT/MGAT family acyltransferase
VDDRHFDLGYHVRHLSLPRPGTLDQLRELAGRIFSRPLDRSHPLWETWVIEGLQEGEQFALLTKIHHCMLDGAAGADLTRILFSPSASAEVPEPVPYLPRPEPTPGELLRDALRDRATQPLRGLQAARRRVERDGSAVLGDVGRRARALADLASWALRPASETPLNGELSPHRRFEWLTMPLDDVREIRRVLGCTINDAVLAILSGALRRYLFRRRVDPAALDFRISAPVNVRRAEHTGPAGNHVSSWILRLPLDRTDPIEQLEAIGACTASLKASGASLGIETVMAAAEWLPADWIARGTRLARGPVNMIVTNVPGPQLPLYTVGSRLLGLYPLVPLIPGGGLGAALFSYEGRLCWGFNADHALVPDLDAFVADLGASFEHLRAASVERYMSRRTAEPEKPPPASAQARRRRAKRGAKSGSSGPEESGGAPGDDARAKRVGVEAAGVG